MVEHNEKVIFKSRPENSEEVDEDSRRIVSQMKRAMQSPEGDNGCHKQNEGAGVVWESRRGSLHHDYGSSPISMHL